LITEAIPAEPTGAVARSVCDSQVHSAALRGSAHTVPDSLGRTRRVLVLFAVCTVFDCHRCGIIAGLTTGGKRLVKGDHATTMIIFAPAEPRCGKRCPQRPKMIM